MDLIILIDISLLSFTLILLLSIHLYLSVNLIRRRFIQPIRFRSLYMLLAIGLGIIISSIWSVIYLLLPQILSSSSSILCSQLSYILWAADIMMIIPLFLRAIRLFIIFTPRKSKVLTTNNNNANINNNNNNNNVQTSSSLATSSSSSSSTTTSASSTVTKSDKSYPSATHQRRATLQSTMTPALPLVASSHNFQQLRTNHLNNNNNISSSSQLTNNNNNSNNNQQSYLNKKPPVITDNHLLIILLIIFIISILILIILNNILNISITHGGYLCADVSAEVWCIVGFISCTSIYIIYKNLKNVRKLIRDDFAQTYEYIMISIIWIFYWIYTFILLIFTSDTTFHNYLIIIINNLILLTSKNSDSLNNNDISISVDMYHYLNTPAMLLRNILLYIIIYYLPYYLSLKNNQNNNNNNFTALWSTGGDALMTLESTLHDIVTMDYFTQFMTQKNLSDLVLSYVEMEIWMNEYDQRIQQYQHKLIHERKQRQLLRKQRKPRSSSVSSSSSGKHRQTRSINDMSDLVHVRAVSSSSDVNGYSNMSSIDDNDILEGDESMMDSNIATANGDDEEEVMMMTVMSEADMLIMYASAQRIYDKYLTGQTSVLELNNLSSSLAQSIHLLLIKQHQEILNYLKINNLPRNLFFLIQLELIKLMQNYFIDFLTSEYCEECLHELEYEDYLRQTLEQSGMI